MEEQIRILVVDDEKVIRDGCRRVLADNKYDVICAENGQAAMSMLEKEKVDIILLDLKMPVMSGEEVLEQTSDLYADIPIIIITGHGTIDTAVECMKKGAYDFITKPFQIDQFLLTIKRASEKRTLEQKAKQFEEENIKNLYDLTLEKSRLKTIINCMANGVMVTNRNMEIVLYNPALMRLLEITTDHIDSPIPVNKIINDNDLIKALNDVQAANSSESKAISQEIELKKNTLRAISAPAYGPDNSVVGTVTVLEDITAFKELDEMKSDFVNMVAHELRSPIVAIRQQNSVLLEGLAGPLQKKQEEFLERGILKIDQLLELINDLLDIAKIEAGKHIQHQTPTDIGKIIIDTITFLEQRAEAQGIKLHHELENMQPVQADPKRIEEVFSNLITNAINYSPEGGIVTVSAHCLSDYMEIRISDTGVGIPGSEIPKIFDKFYRVKDPKTRKVMGTGLGLSIVKGIIEAHNGTIEVESVQGEGTTFRILMPLVTYAR
ncbi:MAG: response regulator [Desulfobacteraceae bacterium]|jgi:signal transduction histidine kinase/AmiR/NasT family two-component response regulator